VSAVHFVLPGDVDDVTRPSGGNVYDRRVCGGLKDVGWPVEEVVVDGEWPRPDPAARSGLARALAALPDGAVVLLDGLVACGVPEVVVPEGNRLRLAVLVHLPLADETGLDPAVAADLEARERETLHAARAVVVTSSWAARRLAARHRLVGSRVHVVTPGADPAPLAPGTDGISRLLCVASVIPRKGQDLLVDALADIADLPWRCECVGPLLRDPDYVRALGRSIAELGFGDRVRLVGPRTGERLAATYAAADLVVLPSRAETYGMVVTEALARGIPVLATEVDSVPDTLGRDSDGGVPGMLVRPEDPQALAEGLRRWFAERELRRVVRTSARRRRGMLSSWDETARRMAAVLGQLPD
jgi:glycosyltransferase involved in cell wall biosynthesis